MNIVENVMSSNIRKIQSAYLGKKTRFTASVQQYAMNAQYENTLTGYSPLLVCWSDVLVAKGQMDAWRYHRVHNIMAKGPTLYTRDCSCHESCCHYVNTNTFLGNCDGWMKTTDKRIGSCNLRHVLLWI